MLFLPGQIKNQFKNFFAIVISECELCVQVSDHALLYRHILLMCYVNIFKTFEKLKESVKEFCGYQCGKYLGSETEPCTLVVYTYLKLYIM